MENEAGKQMAEQSTPDAVFVNARLATMTANGDPYGAVMDGAIAVSGGKIVWLGAGGDLPDAFTKKADAFHDLNGAWVTPGLIDCHTHIVYGGDRAQEFEMRLEGATYEEIARADGGIVSTMNDTRAASEDELVAAALPRVHDLMAEGVSVIEIKSGYGLELETELRQLRAARRIAGEIGVNVQTTFLGAHALPPEFAGRADDYIDLVCGEMVPEVARLGLADAVDVFCEGIGFSAAQTERVFRAARAHDLPVKGHVGQLSDLGGAALAARYGALSCDHLEYVADSDIAAMAKAGTVAVLLPGAYYTLRETSPPPVALFREHGVAMAIATDSNPGSSPLTSLLLTMNMACTLFAMTPEEALAGVTREAARALGLTESHGTLAVGMAADFAIWGIQRPAELSYRLGANPCQAVVRGGVLTQR